MDVAHQLISIFCDIDDFCKELDAYTQHKLLSGPSKGSRGPACQLALSEIMTILVMFHFIRFRDFKTFYTGHMEKYWRYYFPKLLILAVCLFVILSAIEDTKHLRKLHHLVVHQSAGFLGQSCIWL